MTTLTNLGRSAALLLTAGLLMGCGSVDAKPIGGTVRVLATWQGAERQAFMKLLEPFEQATGIKVEYQSTNDLSGQLWKGVATGDLPDVSGLPGPGEMREFAKAGALVDLTKALDVARYKRETAPAFVDLATVDDKLVGVFTKSTVKGLVWFNPKQYTLGAPASWDDLARKASIAARGATKTWCLGLESGQASGWPGTDWIEDIVLHQSGPEVYDDWVAWKISWSSPAIKTAFETFGEVIKAEQVFGGRSGALGTAFGDAGTPLFDDPAGCLFLHQASFMTSFFRSNSGAPDGEYDFFPFPTMNPRYSGSLIAAGDLFGMFRDTPQARALMQYLVGRDAQSLLVKSGGALSANLSVTDYPDDIAKREAALLQTASVVRFDASDLMPDALNEAFTRALIDYTRDPAALDDILAGLDVAQDHATQGR